MIGGKVMMDRNAPEGVLDTAQSSYDDWKALIEAWHGRGRGLYAMSPRFAITSTPEQMEMAEAFVAEHPDCTCRRTSRRTATRSTSQRRSIRRRGNSRRL